MAIIGAFDSLKYKLMVRMFKDVAVLRYISLPRFSFTNYQDLAINMVQHIYFSKHRKVSITSLFNVFHENSESLKEYIKVSQRRDH